MNSQCIIDGDLRAGKGRIVFILKDGWDLRQFNTDRFVFTDHNPLFSPNPMIPKSTCPKILGGCSLTSGTSIACNQWLSSIGAIDLLLKTEILAEIIDDGVLLECFFVVNYKNAIVVGYQIHQVMNQSIGKHDNLIYLISVCLLFDLTIQLVEMCFYLGNCLDLSDPF